MIDRNANSGDLLIQNGSRLWIQIIDDAGPEFSSANIQQMSDVKERSVSSPVIGRHERDCAEKGNGDRNPLQSEKIVAKGEGMSSTVTPSGQKSG